MQKIYIHMYVLNFSKTILGVLHGAVLGQPLFILYSNELVLLYNCSIHIFVNDALVRV